MADVEHFPHMAAAEVAAAGQLEARAAFDHSLIGTLDLLDETGVEAALAMAYRLYRDRDAWLSPAQRIEILKKAAQIMSDQAEELAVEAAREGGKPLLDSRVEVARALDGMHICIETLRTQGGEEIPMGVNAASLNRLAFTRLAPIGVVVAFSAFNHPLNLIVHQVGPAVAAGCPVIVKPAPDTPLSCFRFIRILRQAGLPEAWAQALLTTDNDVSARLVTDERVGFFSFIGSPGVGWWLRSRLAPGTRCALEHGGAAPVIVAADADLDDVVPLLAKGGFYHAGQVCVSVQRIFAQEDIARDLAKRIAEQGKAMSVGDPTSAETAIGPLIRPAEADRVHEWVTEAVEAGADLLCGGDKISDNCYPATVLYDPPADVRVSTHEVFGPVVCVYPYRDLDAAIAQANALPFAFQAAVFSKGLDTSLRAYRRLDASAVMVNDFTAFRVDWMPFAGLRQSGMGVGGIPHTMADMQIEKMMVLRSGEL